MHNVRKLLIAMFPGNEESGWPPFLDCVPVSQWQFDEALMVWLTDELDKIEIANPQSTAVSTLAHLSQQSYSLTLRFQTQAVEQYFSSEYFVAQFSKQKSVKTLKISTKGTYTR